MLKNLQWFRLFLFIQQIVNYWQAVFNIFLIKILVVLLLPEYITNALCETALIFLFKRFQYSQEKLLLLFLLILSGLQRISVRKIRNPIPEIIDVFLLCCEAGRFLSKSLYWRNYTMEFHNNNKF